MSLHQVLGVSMTTTNEPNVATKVDVAKIETEIAVVRTEMAVVRTEMAQMETRLVKQYEGVRTEIANVKFDLLKWLVPIILGQTAATFALARFWGG